MPRRGVTCVDHNPSAPDSAVDQNWGRRSGRGKWGRLRGISEIWANPMSIPGGVAGWVLRGTGGAGPRGAEIETPAPPEGRLTARADEYNIRDLFGAHHSR